MAENEPKQEITDSTQERMQALGATATFAAMVGEAQGNDDLVASCGD